MLVRARLLKDVSRDKSYADDLVLFRYCKLRSSLELRLAEVHPRSAGLFLNAQRPFVPRTTKSEICILARARGGGQEGALRPAPRAGPEKLTGAIVARTLTSIVVLVGCPPPPRSAVAPPTHQGETEGGQEEAKGEVRPKGLANACKTRPNWLRLAPLFKKNLAPLSWAPERGPKSMGPFSF